MTLDQVAERIARKLKENPFEGSLKFDCGEANADEMAPHLLSAAMTRPLSSPRLAMRICPLRGGGHGGVQWPQTVIFLINRRSSRSSSGVRTDKRDFSSSSILGTRSA